MKNFWALVFLITLTACGVNKHITKSLNELENTFQDHVGFVLYDLENDEYLINKNGDRYFTPASNTKILTFYTSLRLLEDRIPGLYYQESGDSLIVWGTGDPSFLYEPLQDSSVFNFLSSTKKSIYFSTGNFHDQHFGPGWSWDDYLYSYSTEKSSLPIYGNYLTIRKQRDSATLTLDIPYFEKYFTLGDSIKKSQITRHIGSNEMVYEPAFKNEAFKREVPFKPDLVIVANLLADTLKRPVAAIDKQLPNNYTTFYSMPTDSVLKVMMQDSDNFVAEQLLLVCSGILSDSLDAEITIDWALDSLFNNSPDKMVWVDGSGLSRYNLFTPRSLVWLWKQLYTQYEKERIFPLIAAGGESGTIKNYYHAEPPYIYGKTGTLSNNHNLSGFLITASGKVLLFSFMNNNYPDESRPVKKEMEKILWQIHEKY